MLGNLGGWHLLIIVFLVLLLFGAPKLPGLAKSLGQSMKIFKNEVKSDRGQGADDATQAPHVAEAERPGAAPAAAPASDPAANGPSDPPRSA